MNTKSYYQRRLKIEKYQKREKEFLTIFIILHITMFVNTLCIVHNLLIF